MSNTMTNEAGCYERPLLSALLFGNDNNNNNHSANGTAIPDTLDPKNYAFELRSPSNGNGNEDIANSHGQTFVNNSDATDGPLLLTLLMGNNNNNDAAKAIADTLDPSNFYASELKYISDGEKAKDISGLPMASLPLNGNNEDSRDTIREAIPDVLELKSQVLELRSPLNSDNKDSEDTIREAIPDVLELKSQVLELDSFLRTKDDIEAATPQFHYLPSVAASIQPEYVSSTTSMSHVPLNESKLGYLSNEQLQFWRDNGYLVIPNALSASGSSHELLLKTVNDAAETLARGGNNVQMHSYLPGQQSYTHPKGRAIAVLSQHAFKPGTEPLKRIQRLGCGIHRVIPPFRKAILSNFHSQLAQSLGYKDPRIIQSLVIVKAAEVGARVVPHQDGCSGFTDPPSCTTFWYALEDATVENGCLAVAPGSHRTQPITRRCRLDETGKPEFINLEKPVFAEIDNVSDSAPPSKKNENGEYEYKKLEVKAGTLILMHGNLMHTSDANRSDKSRVAFNFGVVEGGLNWLSDNYLQPYDGETEFERL